MRVLVVEDDVLVGDAVRRALIAAGFAADLVGSAEAAKTALMAESFDLAVLDVGLPRGKRYPITARSAQQRSDAARAHAHGA